MFTCVEESVVATRSLVDVCGFHTLSTHWNNKAFFRVAPTLAFYLLVDLFSLVCSSLV